MKSIFDKVNAKNVVPVIGLRRSGTHGIINWLIPHYEWAVFVNDYYKGSSKNLHVYKDGIKNFTLNKSRVNEELISKIGVERPDLFTTTLENLEISHIDLLSTAKKRIVFTKVIILLRDPFNHLASLIRGRRTKAAHAFTANVKFFEEYWKSYAKEFIVRDHEEQAVYINYNKWFLDEKYRRGIEKQLGVGSNDNGLHKPKSSSFEKVEDAQALGVLSRWKLMHDDASFTEKIVNFSPDLWAMAIELYPYISYEVMEHYNLIS